VLANVDRAVTGLITAVPALLLVLAGWQLWHRGLQWRDIAIFLPMYVATGLGVTVGFHRLLTHRSFRTSAPMRALLAILGTMSVEGPVISWVADHRKHHAYADRLGDPHSPHVDHGGGWRGALRGLAHAHVGWLFDHQQRGARERFAPDLIADPVVAFVDRTFALWSLVGLAIPFGLGALLGGSVQAGLEGMLWGGAVRIFVLHHVTYSINSLCHFFGSRRFATDDHSRNLLWLAPLSFGEAWHNNHHAFPTSAFHGMGRREIDLSGMLISGLERVGLVWDVQRVGRERQLAKALPR
jgi:stearoyl-CoA desaturase (Delta-9 desaturase)